VCGLKKRAGSRYQLQCLVLESFISVYGAVNWSVISWSVELEGRCGVELVFVCRKKEEYSLRELTKIVNDIMVLKDRIF
jgi:hypothetical protein